MCARFELDDRVFRPGLLIPAGSERGPIRITWAGFARVERIAWWKRLGGGAVDIWARRFAERADDDGSLRWETVPEGSVIRGIIDPREGRTVLKVVTRAATDEEQARFRHDRMPLLEAPAFERPPATATEGPPLEEEGDLFGWAAKQR